ncbi:MAG TPA: hypothetical protein VJN67_04820 [Stellaceae bacterium]|nr:hypothetical protein [Stellaceae bacterium]
MSVADPTARAGVGLGAAAEHLTGALERASAEGRGDALSPAQFQDLMAAMCRTYVAQLEAGHTHTPLRDRNAASNTDVMIMASALLKSANLAVFELGMWQSLAGR